MAKPSLQVKKHYLKPVARLQISIQLFQTLIRPKLYHTKRDHPANFFLHFTRTSTSKFAY